MHPPDDYDALTTVFRCFLPQIGGMECFSELFFWADLFTFFWFLAFHQTRCVSSAALGISHFSSHWFTPLCEGTTWHRYQSVSWHCCRHPLFGLAFCKLCYTLVFLFYLAANGVWDDFVFISGALSRDIWTVQSISIRLNFITFSILLFRAVRGLVAVHGMNMKLSRLCLLFVSTGCSG